MNKEIEEILNYMKQYVENKYEHDSEPMLNYKDLQIVLSYIEQLEKENERLQQENQQLKKQKDDVVEYIKNYIELEDAPINERIKIEFKELLRMLGEIE